MTQGTPALADRTLTVGDLVSHYRLIGMVGGGSLGRLYVAEQRKIRDVSNTVALRCVYPELARQPGFHSCFTAAASFAPRLEHPNILSIHEMNVAEGRYFFSMEYLPGESVASILTRCNTGSPVPSDIAVAIVKQAANAAEYVHTVAAPAASRTKLGHGELSPSTLFVTYHGTVRWLVTGLHEVHEVGPAASGEHAVNGSTAFRAPEQNDGMADARSDVFSLGALLWTFLTGHRPQLPHAVGELDSAALGRGVPPSSIQPQVPEALDAIVMRALSPEPRQRYQSARELSEALDRYLLQRDGRPTHKHIRRWMEQLFDAERAALQLQIARGRDVAAALAALAAQHGGGSAPAPPRSSRLARELWSTRHSMFSRAERVSLEPAPGSFSYESLPVSERDLGEAPATYRAVSPQPLMASSSRAVTEPPARQRPWLIGAVLAGCASLSVAAAMLLSSADHRSPLREAPSVEHRGQLEVSSKPAGAAVFIDGEPTGLRTPAVLKGFASGRSLRVRVEKPGYGTQEREVEIAAGSAVTQAFDLVASAGLVHFAGVPAGARLFIDNARADLDGKPLSLSVGQHAVRVETQTSLVFSGTVVVVAGEQTIRVDDPAVTP